MLLQYSCETLEHAGKSVESKGVDDVPPSTPTCQTARGRRGIRADREVAMETGVSVQGSIFRDIKAF